MKQLTKQEIHQLAMQEVGDYLKSEGYEFLAVNSQMKRSPQFVCVKEKKLFFILVQGSLYPAAPTTFDRDLVTKVKEHATKNNAALFFCWCWICSC